MRDDDGFLTFGGVNQADNILCQVVKGVSMDSARLIAARIAPLIGSPHAVALLGEKVDLCAPDPPEFRIAMQENNQLTVAWSSLGNL